jgi:hypothetical protein
MKHQQSETTSSAVVTYKLTVDWSKPYRVGSDEWMISHGFRPATAEDIAKYHKFTLCDGKDPNSWKSILGGFFIRIFKYFK